MTVHEVRFASNFFGVIQFVFTVKPTDEDLFKAIDKWATPTDGKISPRSSQLDTNIVNTMKKMVFEKTVRFDEIEVINNG